MKKKLSLICVFVIFIVAGIASSLFIYNDMKKETTEKLCKELTNNVYRSVDKAISEPIVMSQTMANNTFLKKTLLEETKYSEKEMIDLMQEYLTEMKSVLGAQSAFLVSEQTKRYYTYEGLNKVLDPKKDEHDVWYSIFTDTRKPYVLHVDKDQVHDDDWTIFVNARIEDEKGQLLGVCGVGVSLKQLQSVIESFEKENNIQISFVDKEGNTQLDRKEIKVDKAHMFIGQNGKEKDGYYYQNEKGQFVNMRYIDELTWYLVTQGE